VTAIRRRSLQIDDPLATGTTPAQEYGSSTEGETGAGDGRLQEIPLEQIRANPDQPRKRFEESALTSLAESIRERGVLQPIIVQPRAAGGYELIAGERRWRASKIAGIAAIPALVAQPLEAGHSVELALIENVAREDLGVIEPGGIALNASFGRSDDAIPSGFGAFGA
jgi:ParB/RepB/Spo0J family partition protein